MHAQCMITTVLPWDRASAGEFMHILQHLEGQAPLLSSRGLERETPLVPARLRPRRRGCSAWVARWRASTRRAAWFGRGHQRRGEDSADFVVSSAGIKRTVQMAGPANFRESTSPWSTAWKRVSLFAVKFFLDRKIKSLRAPCTFHIPDLLADHMFDYLKDRGASPPTSSSSSPYPASGTPCWRLSARMYWIVGECPRPRTCPGWSSARACWTWPEVSPRKSCPEIKGHMVDKVRTHIAHTSHLTGRATGECIGLAQEVGQSGSPQAKRHARQGLYLVGSDAGGRGIGMRSAPLIP